MVFVIPFTIPYTNKIGSRKFCLFGLYNASPLQYKCNEKVLSPPSGVHEILRQLSTI